MSENENVNVNESDTDPEVPAPAGVSPEQIALIREKLKQFTQSDEKTISGSEAPVDERPTGEVMDGKDVDWSEYNLEFNVRHLYRQARFQMTPQGPKWVALVDEFHSAERSFANYGTRVNIPGGKDKIDTEPLNLGSYLNDMLNSPEGWRLVSILPATSGRVGVLLQRSVPIVLPDPVKIETTTEVPAPKDGELAEVEDAAQKFMEAEGLTPEGSEEQNESEGTEEV